jgi:hypothetical protein
MQRPKIGRSKEHLSKSFTIVGIAGSLRKKFYNKQLLKAAGKLLPNDFQFIIADISCATL